MSIAEKKEESQKQRCNNTVKALCTVNHWVVKAT